MGCYPTRRLSTIEARLSLAKTGGKIAFPQFLEMFRADLLDLKEIMAFLQMGSSAPASKIATVPEVSLCSVSAQHMPAAIWFPLPPAQSFWQQARRPRSGLNLAKCAAGGCCAWLHPRPCGSYIWCA